MLKNKFILTVIFILGFFLYLSIIFGSGTNYQFWGAHGHDGLWHAAVAQVSFSSYPPNSPIYSGVSLVGYNYASDILSWLLHFIGISPITSYFKIIPLLFLPVYFYLINKLGQSIDQSKSKYFLPIFIAIFLFTGSFGWILTLHHNSNLAGSATLLTDQILHTMSNWPYAFSLLTFISSLIIMSTGKFDKKSSFTLISLTVLTAVFKLYGGVVLFPMVALYFMFTKSSLSSKIIRIGLLTVATACAVFVFYRPDISSTRLIFSPFSIINKITEESTQFHLAAVTNARYSLEEVGWGPRLFAIYALNTLLFFFFHLGIRFFGLLYLLYLLARGRLKTFDYAMGVGILVSFAAVVLFIQSGEWWNPTQFVFYALIILSIYTALIITKIANKSFIIGLAVLLLGSVELYDLVKSFAFTPPTYEISGGEVVALKYLAREPKGIVLAENSSNSAYVTAISGMQSYLANPAQLKVLGVSYHARESRIKKGDCSVLGEIDYLYLQKGDQDLEKFMICSNLPLVKIYDSSLVEIYRVGKNR